MVGELGVRGASLDAPVPGVQGELVDVAPAPVLARLERLDDRVVRGVEVLSNMLVLRVVAAADVAADHAQAQMHPSVADLEAVLAAVRAWRHRANLVEMRTGLKHHNLQ